MINRGGTFDRFKTFCMVGACADKNEEVTNSSHQESATATLFKSGAEISGVNGIHFGPDGMLYATSVIGSTISVVDTQAVLMCLKLVPLIRFVFDLIRCV